MTRRLASIPILLLIIASIMSLVAVHAAEEFSFHKSVYYVPRDGAEEVIITGPSGLNSIDVVIVNTAGAQVTQCTAQEWASGKYVVYLVAPGAGVNTPKVQSFCQLPNPPAAGDYVKYYIYVTGTDIKATIIYGDTKAAISVDRDELPLFVYSNYVAGGIATLEVTDYDQDKDPTSVQTINSQNYGVTITDVTLGRGSSVTTTLDQIVDEQQCEETGVDSGTFACTLDAKKVYEVLKNNNIDVKPGHTIKITISDSGYELGDYYLYVTLKHEAPVATVFEYVDFKNGVNVSISWFDANRNIYSKDYLKLVVNSQDTNGDGQPDIEDWVNPIAVLECGGNPVDEEYVSLKETGKTTEEFVGAIRLAYVSTNPASFNGYLEIPVGTVSSGTLCKVYIAIRVDRWTYDAAQGKWVHDRKLTNAIYQLPSVPLKLELTPINLTSTEANIVYGSNYVVISFKDPDLVGILPGDYKRITNVPAGSSVRFYLTYNHPVSGATADLVKFELLDESGQVVTTPVDLNIYGKEVNGVIYIKISVQQGQDPTQLFRLDRVYKLKVVDYTYRGGYVDYVTVRTVIPAYNLTIDRSEYPLPVRGNAVIHVKLVAPTENADPYTIDHVPLCWIVVPSGYTPSQVVNALSGIGVNAPYQIWLTETSTNSGVFEGTITLRAADLQNIINALGLPGLPASQYAKLVVWYELSPDDRLPPTDPQANPDTERYEPYVEAVLKVHYANLSVEPESPSIGDTITIKVYEPDANLDSEEQDILTVSMRIVHPRLGTSAAQNIVLVETEPNSNIFEAKIKLTLDSYVRVMVGQQVMRDTLGALYNGFLVAGAKIEVRYVDSENPSTPSTETAFTATTLSDSITIATHKAIVKIDKEEYGPGAIMVINITDPDLNLHVGRDAISNPVYITIEGCAPIRIDTAGQNAVFRVDTQGHTITVVQPFEEVAPGVFVAKIRLPAPLQNVRYPFIDRKVVVVYVDDTPEGTTSNMVEATIKAWNGTIELDKDVYNVGDLIKITVKDPDRNIDPTSIDRVTVVLASTSFPTGFTVTLYETGPNTGVFIAVVPTSNVFESGKLLIKSGDTIYVRYLDAYPVNFAVTGQATWFEKTASVGVAVIEKPIEVVNLSEVKLVDSEGKPISTIKPYQMAAIAIPVKNLDTSRTVSFDAIVFVKKEGVPVAWNIVPIAVAPGETKTIYVALPILAEPGTYTVEILLWTSLEEAKPISTLAEPITMTITVQG